MEKKAFYSPEEVAQYFDVSIETIRRMCREGAISGARQIGRQWRIPATFLEESSSIQQTEQEKQDPEVSNNTSR